MTAATYTLQMVLRTLSGWVSRHQQDMIKYLIEENRGATNADIRHLR